MCMVEMAIFNIQRAISLKVEKKTSVAVHVFCMSSQVFNIVSSFMKICQTVLNLWSGHKNCKHTEGNKSKSRKTRVTVHVFCTSSHGV